MGFVWRGNSGGHSPPRPLSHLSLLSSTPRANKRPCVAAAGLELHRPCVRLRWTTQTDAPHPPHPSPPRSSHLPRSSSHGSVPVVFSLTLRRLTCRGNIVSVVVDPRCQIPLLTIRAFFLWSFNFTLQLQLCVDKS